MKFFVQTNLRSEEDNELFRVVIQKYAEYVPTIVIPFSETLELDGFKDGDVLFGSTTMVLSAYRHPEYQRGVWYKPEWFTGTHDQICFGDDYLNNDAWIGRLADLPEDLFGHNDLVFVKADADDKQMTGSVMTFNQVVDMKTINQKFTSLGLIDRNMKIQVASPKEVEAEYRLFVVDKKVVASSMYRPYQKKDAPKEVLDFVQERISKVESDVFVVDVGVVNDAYYIVETNCPNASGFYKSDMDTIIKSLVEFRNSSKYDKKLE